MRSPTGLTPKIGMTTQVDGKRAIRKFGSAAREKSNRRSFRLALRAVRMTTRVDGSRLRLRNTKRISAPRWDRFTANMESGSGAREKSNRRSFRLALPAVRRTARVDGYRLRLRNALRADLTPFPDPGQRLGVSG